MIKIDLFRNCRLLLPGGVNRKVSVAKSFLAILMYTHVHSGCSKTFSCPGTKILGFERGLIAFLGLLGASFATLTCAQGATNSKNGQLNFDISKVASSEKKPSHSKGSNYKAVINEEVTNPKTCCRSSPKKDILDRLDEQRTFEKTKRLVKDPTHIESTRKIKK